MKKKGVTLFLAVITFLLMASNVIGAGATVKNNIDEKSNYIDPNIHLTTAELSNLEETVQYVEDPVCKELMLNIMEVIKKNGDIGSSELEEILTEMEVFGMDIYKGCIYGGAGNNAFIKGIPLVFAMWSCKPNGEDYCTIKINDEVKLPLYHSGFALSPVGVWHSDFLIHPGGWVDFFITISVMFSPLIIIY